MNSQGRSNEPLDAAQIIPENDSNFYIQELPATPSQSQRRFSSFIHFYLPSLIVAGLVFSAVGYEIAHVNAVRNANKILDALCLCDAVDMTQAQLEQVVTHNHLHVYWEGAVVQTNVRYRLNASDPTSITLTIVPGTPQVRAENNQIITYVQNNAFRDVLASGQQNPGDSSFINTDGNAVFYTEQNPEIAYVGIKNQNFEVEIYSSAPGEALVIAKSEGRLTLIK